MGSPFLCRSVWVTTKKTNICFIFFVSFPVGLNEFWQKIKHYYPHIFSRGLFLGEFTKMMILRKDKQLLLGILARVQISLRLIFLRDNNLLVLDILFNIDFYFVDVCVESNVFVWCLARPQQNHWIISIFIFV